MKHLPDASFLTPQERAELRNTMVWLKKAITENALDYDQWSFCGTQCCFAGWLDVKHSGAAHKANDMDKVLANAYKEIKNLEARDLFWDCITGPSLGDTGVWWDKNKKGISPRDLLKAARDPNKKAKAGVAAINNWMKKVGL